MSAGLGARVARWRAAPWFADAVALGVIVAVVVCYLAPAIRDGPSFGPTDIGRGLSVFTHLVPAPANHNVINGDLITQGIPWNSLDWQLVHHGQLPLWNDLSGTGLPQLLNFESAPLALPTLLGYLFPLRLAFLVTVAGKLLIAGFGTYLACRLLACRPLAAAFGAVTFMCSGSFAGWLGWSVSGPIAWAGFLVAGVLLAYRHRRVRDVGLLALAVAFAIYGGFPESYVLLAGGLAAFLGVAGLAQLARDRTWSWRGLGAIATGAGAGLALAAPLWFAGLPVLTASARNGKQAAAGLPVNALALLFAPGYDGLPLSSPGAPQGTWFGPVNYFETAAYAGIAALVFGLVALFLAWRRPAVAGLVLAVAGTVALVYRTGVGPGPVQHLVSTLGLGALALQRMLGVLGFLLACLGALGLELCLARWRERRVGLAYLGALGLLGLVCVALLVKSGAGLPAADAALRRRSLAWPFATLGLLGGLGVLAYLRRGLAAPAARRLGAALGLVAAGAQGAGLLVAGVGINSYGTEPFPMTAAVAELKGIVGSDLVGLDAGNTTDVRQWRGIGFYPNVNLGYGIDELAMHDPTIPQSYFDAWPVPNADQVSAGNLNVFVPALTSATLARRYGARYVLAAPGLTPTGTRRVATIAGLELFAVPGASRFSFAAGTHGAAGTVGAIAHPSDATYRVRTTSRTGGVLVARITATPGWHASADGRPLRVSTYEGAFLAVSVPSGVHEVTFSYFPRRLAEGFLAALVALSGFALAGLLGLLRRRRDRPGSGAPAVATDRGEPAALVASKGA